MARKRAKRSLMPPLTTSLRWMTPSTRVAVGDGERRAARVADACRPRRRARAGIAPPERAHVRARRRRPRPCGCARPSRSQPLMRVCAREGDEVRADARRRRGRAGRSCSLTSTTIERPSGVSSARLASCAASASSSIGTPGDREELGRHAVAERDGAGLVEQQHVDVAGRLDGAAAHREHVLAQQPVHAGDADGREQAADGGRDEADEQRDDHRSPRARRPSRARAAPASRRRTGR